MSLIIPFGTSAPVTLSISITPYDPSLDLTTVTAVALEVSRQADGGTATWVASIAGGATPSLVVVNYTFASAGVDFPVTGPYFVTPVLTVPGGTVIGTVVDILVPNPQQFHYPIASGGN